MKRDMKKVADKAVKGHESRMHKSAMKMAKGGVTSEQMKQMGSGMARVKNQGSK